MEASPIKTAAQRGGITTEQSARKRFVIAMREPFNLPDNSIELPSPGPLPGAPPTVNLVSSILPPVMMLGAVLVYSRMVPGANPAVMILMPMMSMAFPVGSLISYYFQKKQYQKKLQFREKKYQGVLNQVRERIDAIAQQQRSLLEKEYPQKSKLMQIAQGNNSRRRLWWRRFADPDFLHLRMGTGLGEASFSIALPKAGDPNEPLLTLAADVVGSYREINQLPVLLNLHNAGSVAVDGKSETDAYNLVRRLVLDLVVHHSPQEVQIAVLADLEAAQKRWEWLKWTPHTRAILQGESLRRIAFNPTTIDKCIEWLQTEFNQRRNVESGVRRRTGTRQAIVVIVDDTGDIRQSRDIKQLAESGFEADIYLIFAGGKHWPRECRTRIDLKEGEFSYVETWVGEKNSKRTKGTIDPASLSECEAAARALAGLELSSAEGGDNLPTSVRLYDLQGLSISSPEIVKQNWLRLLAEDELLKFSFGLRRGRKGLEEVELNLLPEDLGGHGAYHTILVGTTGSGKSEFMKSLVLSAACRYSPKRLNFFFMDFKGGAAFNVLKELPHVVGVVTNLSPELVERGLSAVEAEINRRQKWFAEDGVQNIWEYNARHLENPMPHLLLLLDEFARGMEDFERLPDMLDRLVRQGRSLGMYMLLANQDVNPVVDRLLNNVGWRIALKVARQDEMHIIDRALSAVKRAGQGYLLTTNGEPIEFQAAYAGLRLPNLQEEVEAAFKIFQVEADGKRQLIHTGGNPAQGPEGKRPIQIEQDHLISQIKIVAKEFEPARPIYLDPLEEHITLERVFEGSALQRVFTGTWDQNVQRGNRLIAPVGFLDSPKECLQEELEIDFEERDGHLWIVGGAGSGKAMTVETILFSLALTHTPEEIHYYILDFGAGGRLQKFDNIPHTGAIFHSTDSDEYLNRILKYLESVMDRRTALLGNESADHVTKPAIFLVINNFAEMRESYPDQTDRIARFGRDGKAVGLHLIVTTNRKMELRGLTIDRQIILRLSNREEYMDAIGRSVALPSSRAEGRGFWAVDQRIVECQVAQAIVKVGDEDSLQDARTVCKAMKLEWHGESAPRILTLATQIALRDLLEKMNGDSSSGIHIPLGISYETMELVTTQPEREIPRWLVLGPPRSGKSNFLASLATSVLAQDEDHWDVHYFSLRRSPLDWIHTRAVQVSRSTNDIVQACEKITQALDEQTADSRPRSVLLLIDDLGGAFEPGKDAIVTQFNKLALNMSSHELLYVVAAGMRDELLRQVGSLLVQNLRQGRTGLNFSKDPNDFDWFGAQFPRQYFRFELPQGRGFWISGGNPILLQTPWTGSNPQ